MRNIRIGVVEDDPASCQLVLDYLNRYQQENGEQFTVSVFDDGARIVEKYTPVYDILLLDIEMSEMDGMAAARRIRERDDKVVIVFITAAPQYAISGYEVRALSYLLKPLPWFAFSQELKKSIDMVRRNGDDSMLIETAELLESLCDGCQLLRDAPHYLEVVRLIGSAQRILINRIQLVHGVGVLLHHLRVVREHADGVPRVLVLLHEFDVLIEELLVAVHRGLEVGTDLRWVGLLALLVLLRLLFLLLRILRLLLVLRFLSLLTVCRILDF